MLVRTERGGRMRGSLESTVCWTLTPSLRLRGKTIVLAHVGFYSDRVGWMLREVNLNSIVRHTSNSKKRATTRSLVVRVSLKPRVS